MDSWLVDNSMNHHYEPLDVFKGQLIYALDKFCGTFCAEDWCAFTVKSDVSKPSKYLPLVAPSGTEKPRLSRKV